MSTVISRIGTGIVRLQSRPADFVEKGA
jgi:hypothetical protein